MRDRLVFGLRTGRKHPDEQLARYWNAMIPWLVERAQRYRVLCEPDKKGSKGIIIRLTNHATSQVAVERRVKSKLLDAILRRLARDYDSPDIAFEGVADNTLVEALSLGPLPDESVPADIAPCAEVILTRNGEVLFESYDYGRFQTLYLTEDEANQLRTLLKRLKLSPAVLVEQEADRSGYKSLWHFAGRVNKD